MPDIDVKIDKGNKFAKKASLDALYGEIAALILSMILLVVDYTTAGGICLEIVSSPFVPICGMIGLIIMVFLGERSKHREKTHSLLFMLLFTFSIGFINIPIGVSFFFGYFSHLMIDLLNKSPERLFFPFKRGFCLKICYADRLANELLFSIGLAISTAIVVSAL